MQETEKEKNTYTNATSSVGEANHQKDRDESNANVSLPSTSTNKTQEEQKLNAKYNQLQMEHINMQKQYNEYLLQNPSSTFSFVAGFAVGAAVMGVAFIVVSVIRRKN